LITESSFSLKKETKFSFFFQESGDGRKKNQQINFPGKGNLQKK